MIIGQAGCRKRKYTKERFHREQKFENKFMGMAELICTRKREGKGEPSYLHSNSVSCC